MDTERPYVIEGEFLEVDPPRKLVHTWHSVGAPSAPTTVTYALEPLDGATRITLRHSGFAAPFVAPGMCMNTCIGYELRASRGTPGGGARAEFLIKTLSPCSTRRGRPT